jgi:hypothetical protein
MMGIKIERALKKCRCQKCRDVILHNDYRVPWEGGFFHLKCYINFATNKIKMYHGHRKRLLEKHKKEIEEESNYRILRKI